MNWKKIRHFRKSEWEPGANKVHHRLIHTLDEMRAFCGRPIIIHNAYATTGHSDNSYHYRGEAVDFHIKGISLLWQFLFAERFGFGGIGVYPHWNNPGLHCDIRYHWPESDVPGDRWWRDDGGDYHDLCYAEEFKNCFGLSYDWENVDWLWSYSDPLSYVRRPGEN